MTWRVSSETLRNLVCLEKPESLLQTRQAFLSATSVRWLTNRSILQPFGFFDTRGIFCTTNYHSLLSPG
jgi:hypothetical protein